MQPVPIPEKLGVAETKIAGLIPVKMFVRLVIAFLLFVFIGVLIPLKLNMDPAAKAGTALLSFVFFFVLLVGQKEGIPLLLYLAKMQRYKIRPSRYEKVKGEKARYEPTQNLVGVKEVKGKLVDMGGGTFISILKIEPIDLLLRTEDERAVVYSGEETALNTIDFTVQRIAKPRPYDCSHYVSHHTEILKKLPPEHKLRKHIQKDIKAFTETIEDFKTVDYDFYFVISTNADDLDPSLRREEKAERKAAKNYEEKKKIIEKYKQKRYETAERDLARKRRTFIAAQSLVDPNLEIVELENEELVEALRNCYSHVPLPKAEEVT